MTIWEQKRKTMERRIARVKDYAESIGLPRDYINCWHNCAISSPGIGWAAQVDPEKARRALAAFDRALAAFDRAVNGKNPRI